MRENTMNNTLSNIKRMNMNELRADMTLAKDVINEWGGVLLPKGTGLNEVNFSRLMANGIKYVYIKENSINLKSNGLINQYEESRKKVRPIVQQERFKRFEKTYIEKTEELRQSIISISDGGSINLEMLYKLTDGIMSQLKCKSDVFSYLSFLKTADEHTFAHSSNVALLCNLFGHWLGFNQTQLMYLTAAGALHDLGKTKVDIEILNKTGKLTPKEFEHLKQHTSLGYQMLEGHNIDEDIKLSALMHHEKIDGSGYPLGLKDEKISNFAKIVSICDIYDAMTTNRVYREKLCPFEVIKQFEQQSYGFLDTRYLLIFLQNVAYTYMGSWVELNDGSLGEVVFIQRNNLSQPLVKTGSEEIIDLSVNKDLKIVRIF